MPLLSIAKIIVLSDLLISVHFPLEFILCRGTRVTLKKYKLNHFFYTAKIPNSFPKYILILMYKSVFFTKTYYMWKPGRLFSGRIGFSGADLRHVQEGQWEASQYCNLH